MILTNTAPFQDLGPIFFKDDSFSVFAKLIDDLNNIDYISGYFYLSRQPNVSALRYDFEYEGSFEFLKNLKPFSDDVHLCQIENLGPIVTEDCFFDPVVKDSIEIHITNFEHIASTNYRCTLIIRKKE